jgi:hypothetical protein
MRASLGEKRGNALALFRIAIAEWAPILASRDPSEQYSKNDEGGDVIRRQDMTTNKCCQQKHAGCESAEPEANTPTTSKLGERSQHLTRTR